MFDLFNFPEATRGNVQIFHGSQATGATTDWRPWIKPRGYDFVDMLLIGGGAGGGGGCGGAAGAAKGGGGGGGSSGISRLRYPLYVLPDALYVLVGAGGPGGAAGSSGNGGTGTNGQLSYVAIHPNTTANNILAASGNAAPVGGGGGTNAAAGSAGTAGTIATLATQPMSFWAVSVFFFAGIIGIAGGAQTGAIGGGTALGTAGMIGSGMGGGGSQSADFAGGTFSGQANTPFRDHAPGAAGGGRGSNGFRWDPFPVIYGGTGGGSSNSTTGGAGGDCGVNAPGAGGGGGGAGVTVGGVGGRGGPGLVVMICS